jgi:hypothetical protein
MRWNANDGIGSPTAANFRTLENIPTQTATPGGRAFPQAFICFPFARILGLARTLALPQGTPVLLLTSAYARPRPFTPELARPQSQSSGCQPPVQEFFTFFGVTGAEKAFVWLEQTCAFKR